MGHWHDERSLDPAPHPVTLVTHAADNAADLEEASICDTRYVNNDRASISSRMTLHKLEKGEPGVSIGTVATVLFVLGMSERLAELADIRHDEQGLALDGERLPQRIRRKRRPPAKEKS